MKLNFGEVSKEDSEDFNVFEFKGKTFGYQIEFTPEDVIIRDSCNRSFPMDWESVYELSTILSNYSTEIKTITESKYNGVLSDEEDALIQVV